MSRPRLPSLDSVPVVFTVPRGLEGAAVRELSALGISQVVRHKGAIETRATMRQIMASCLWLRTVNRINIQLGWADVQTDRHLYASIRQLPLGYWFGPDLTLRVDSHVSGPVFTNSMWVSQRAKDAICDAVKDNTGRRPDVSRDAPDVIFDLQIIGTRAYYGISVSGAPLFQRGYRTEQAEAPLKETLAAGLLMMAEYDGREPLHDPMCGSGTLVLEAAMMSANMAPGLGRRFGFETWKFFEELRPMWNDLYAEARGALKTPLRTVVMGSDNDAGSIAQCRKHQLRLGLEGMTFAQRDVLQTASFPIPGLFIMNPPYGHRLGNADEARLARLYTAMGERFATFGEHRVAVFAPPELLDTMRLRWDKRVNVRNGALQCQLRMTRPSRPQILVGENDAPDSGPMVDGHDEEE